jgi:D-lactate dehydrogenase
MSTIDRTGQIEGTIPEGNGAKGHILDYKVAVFSAQPYVKDFLDGPFSQNFAKYSFFDARLGKTLPLSFLLRFSLSPSLHYFPLTPSLPLFTLTTDKSTANLAQGCDAVCLFVNDSADKEVLEILATQGIKMIAMRCAGYDRVDLQAAKDLGIKVTRVPAYSPRSVAEHALSLMFCIARNTHLAYDRVISGNYTLNGLVGVELSGKTFGIVGTGNIGIEMIKLLSGFHGKILAYDVNESAAAVAAGAEYVSLDELLKESDIVSLHVPLLASTHHIINKERIGMMRKHAILINVSRGGLIDTDALVTALENDHLFGVGLDVYDKEDSLFFKDFTEMTKENRMKAWDRSFKLLVSLPQVIVTPHVAFLTQEALKNIGDTVVVNLRAAALGEVLVNEVKAK